LAQRLFEPHKMSLRPGYVIAESTDENQALLGTISFASTTVPSKEELDMTLGVEKSQSPVQAFVEACNIMDDSKLKNDKAAGVDENSQPHRDDTLLEPEPEANCHQCPCSNISSGAVDGRRNSADFPDDNRDVSSESSASSSTSSSSSSCSDSDSSTYSDIELDLNAYGAAEEKVTPESGSWRTPLPSPLPSSWPLEPIREDEAVVVDSTGEAGDDRDAEVGLDGQEVAKDGMPTIFESEDVSEVDMWVEVDQDVEGSKYGRSPGDAKIEPEPVVYPDRLEATRAVDADYLIPLVNKQAVVNCWALAPISLRRQLEQLLLCDMHHRAAEALFAYLTFIHREIHENSIQVRERLTFFKTQAMEVLRMHLHKARSSSALKLQTFWRRRLLVTREHNESCEQEDDAAYKHVLFPREPPTKFMPSMSSTCISLDDVCTPTKVITPILNGRLEGDSPKFGGHALVIEQPPNLSRPPASWWQSFFCQQSWLCDGQNNRDGPNPSEVRISYGWEFA